MFGDGGPGVELCFIGEAPGADEDAQGIPFVGAAGQLLNKIIQACGLKREEVYICNIIKCRPPANRTPLPNEAANCRDFLERQSPRPAEDTASGGCAATNLLGHHAVARQAPRQAPRLSRHSRCWSPITRPICCRIAIPERRRTCGKT